jgi:uncharacterized protein (DUF2147 family)
VEARCDAARAGTFTTPHGTIHTPAFMVVATKGVVPSLDPGQVHATGTEMLVANSYHLRVRPGEEVIRQLGGLHAFMCWEGPLLSDSGGYQVYSLPDREIGDRRGRRAVRSPAGQLARDLTPERSIELPERARCGRDHGPRRVHAVPRRRGADGGRRASHPGLGRALREGSRSAARAGALRHRPRQRVPASARDLRRGAPGARAPRPSPVWVYLPILPLALIQLTLRERFPGPYNLYNDWASVAFYVTFLASGFALAVVPGFEERLRAEWRRVLVLGLAATGVLLAAVLGAFESAPVVLAGSAVAGWCFVVALLGFARERVTRSGPGLPYLAESAFPIYVLHQPVVVVLGAGVILLPLGIATKFVLLLVGSVASTLALYHFGVRPFRATRFLIGMKPPSRAPRYQAIGSPVAAPAPGRSRAWPRFSLLSLLSLLVLLLLPDAARASNPTGLWWAEGGFAQVEIRHCGDGALCGQVVWLRHPFDEHGCELRDVENPEPALRSRPVVGLEIFRDLQASSDHPGEWNGGEIYDPGSGRTYGLVVEMDGGDRLRLRGYLGIRLLGRTTTWVRVGSEHQCREDA